MVSNRLTAFFYWVGGNIPQWRVDNIDTFKRFHPEFDVKVEIVEGYCFSPILESERARFAFCRGGKNRLWIDSDIELLARLPIGERPAVAWEAIPHHSLLWSGEGDFFKRVTDGPSFFQEVNRALYHKQVDTIHPSGICRHWAGGSGDRKPRTNFGYKPEDFN